MYRNECTCTYICKYTNIDVDIDTDRDKFIYLFMYFHARICT